MVAFIVAGATMTALVAPHAGMDLGTGPFTKDDVETVGSELTSPEAPGVGNNDPGFFGISIGVTGTVISVLTTVTMGIDDLLISYQAPPIIAWSVQQLVRLSIGITIIAIFRGIQLRVRS